MIIGIVAEFNPFHAGHKYLIDTVKQPGDCVVAVMSGNFVQRGDFAIQAKHVRARRALENGADLVVELPTPIATMSAEGFCENAVRLLGDMGCVDTLCFGAEDADTAQLRQTARVLNRAGFMQSVTEKMSAEGISFPAARRIIADSPILDKPNNILAVEYLRALEKFDLHMNPCAVQRIGSGHDVLGGDRDFPSASQIRLDMIKDDYDRICHISRCERAILSKLRTMRTEEFLEIPDVTEGLENRIVSAVKQADSLDTLYAGIKSKRYTMSRIRRIILRAYLGITKNDMKPAPYIRVLGFTQAGQQILKTMRETAVLPVIMNYAHIKKANSECIRLFEAECRRTDLYNLGFADIKKCGEEMTENVIRI